MRVLSNQRSVASVFIAVVGLSWGLEIALAAPRDRQAPTPPGNLSANGVTAGGFDLAWSASTDNVGVTGYEVVVNGVSQGTAPATSRTIGGLQADTAHTVYVRARDAVGNWSSPSETLIVKTVADTEPPTIPVALSAGAISASGFTVSWAPSSDNSGSVLYDVIVDGVSQGIASATNRAVSGLQPVTAYSVTVKAGDPSGNWSAASAPITITTAEAPPESHSIAAGLHTVALVRGDGTVWSWGRIGGPAPNRIHPVATAVKVAVSDETVLMLQESGTILAAGNNQNGLCVDGSTTTPISGLTGITGIAVGTGHALAVKSDGTVYAWGTNMFGQVGAGKLGAYVTPTKLKQVGGVLSVTAGRNHSLALKTNGTVLAWGLNASGQLGDGSTTNRTAPITIAGLLNVTALAAGSTHSLALKSDGTVWAWGNNTSGQLGDGTVTTRTSPVQVPGLTNVVAIAAGAEHSLALKSDGSLWSWGANANEQLGDASTIDRSTPGRVTVIQGAVTGCVASGYASFAVMADGTIRSCGGRWDEFSNIPARTVLGDGSSSLGTVPFDDIQQIEGRRYSYLLVLRLDGSVWGWGANTAGQLGDGTNRERVRPVRIEGLDNITQIDRSMALRSDGQALTWGANSRGELGNGTTVGRLTPGVVPGLSGLIQIASGSQHRLALRSDGTVWAWGYNEFGQIGDGTTIDRLGPVQVPNLANIVWIAAGGNNSFAVRSDGTVWSWGYDWWASGTNTGKPESVPLQALVGGITRVATSGSNTLFLTNSGHVFGCGSSNVGVGPWYGTPVPQQIPELQGIVEVSANHGSVARDATGTVWRWGSSPTITSGIATPGLIKSASGLGLVYTDGTGVLWVEPTVPPAGLWQMATQVADVRLRVSALDTDRDGISDDWEIEHFGNLAVSAADDTDGDGLANVQEFLRGTSPVDPNADGDLLPDAADEWPDDFYNNTAPTLVIVGGDGLVGAAGHFNAEPFDLAVWSADGLRPQVNAPVTFEVVTGDGLLAIEPVYGIPGSSLLELRTDIDGSVQTFYRHPGIADVVSTITAAAGLSQATFLTISDEAPYDSDGDGLPDTLEDAIGTDKFNPDTDGDGLPDGWEVANGHDPQVPGVSPDTDADGVNDYDEFRLGRNPNAGVLPGGGAALNLVVLQPTP